MTPMTQLEHKRSVATTT